MGSTARPIQKKSCRLIVVHHRFTTLAHRIMASLHLNRRHIDKYSLTLFRARELSPRVRLVGWAFAGLGVALVAGGCDETSHDPDPREVSPIPSHAPVKRGSRVVVERTAGEFLEATVLREQDGHLRVQTTNGAESLRVAATDVYAIEQPARKLVPGHYAICGVERLLWSGCKVMRTTPRSVVVATLEHEELTLAPDRVLSATELTRMNINEQFLRHDRKQEFQRQLAEAHPPSAPDGWHASPHERVVARRRGDWFTARVHELEDDGIRVRFKGHALPEKLARAEVIPEPPYKYRFKRGDFALLRPKAAADPWIYVRVRASASDLKVEDVSGRVTHVDDTEVIPMPRQ